MSSQHQNIAVLNSIQACINVDVEILSPFYNRLSIDVRQRRNHKQLIVSDLQILALMMFQIERRTVSQRQFHRETFTYGIKIPERSRFSRRCHDLAKVMKTIRNDMLQRWTRHTAYSVIDSAPILLCAPVRNMRAKVFHDVASIGFNATKHLHFYGFKFHCVMTNEGYVAGYEVTKASIHDVRVAEELLEQASSSRFLADVGYLSKDLKQQLSTKGINIWTPLRKIMKQPVNVDITLLKRQRRHIETMFNNLNTVAGFEHPHVRTAVGLEALIEMMLLWHTIKVHDNLMHHISGLKIV